MKIDNKTFEDLEIFSTTGEGGIFDLFNTTVTTEGNYRLKEKFRQPFSSPPDILETQECLKYIVNNFEGWALPFTSQLMDQADLYYFSKVSPVYATGNIMVYIEGFFNGLLIKKFRKTIFQGTAAITTLIILWNRWMAKHDRDEAPAGIKKIFLSFHELLKVGDIQKIVQRNPSEPLSFAERIYYDKVFRITCRKQVIEMIRMIYETDALIAMAAGIRKYNMVFPEILQQDEPVIRIKGVYHLFVKSPIKNNLIMENGKNFMFLSGPNMAGKTTFLKSVGVASYLAHLGMAVPAESMQFTVMNSLFTSLNVSDNLRLGYSYFYSEVLRVKQAAELISSTRKALIIFDELFKGTNIKDAYDGSLQIINGLLNWKSCLFILSSHLLELTKEIESRPNILFSYFESEVQDDKPVFSYSLKEGISEERMGMLIIKNSGIIELLRQ